MKKRKYVKQRLPATRTFDTIQPETHPEEFEWKAVKRLSDTACLAATFSLSCIPPTAQSLVRVISNEGNTDAGNVAASFIAFVSGGLSNIYKVQPEQENKGWHISPNLSGLLVGPASARKSRAYRPIESFVRKAEDQLLFEYSKTEKEELAAYQFAKKKNASREQLVQKMILESLRIERNDPAKAEELMADAERLLMQMENDLEPPSAMTLIINHTTEAGLHKLKTKEIHCHFYVRDEATPLLLETMGRTQSNIKAFLIEAMDGDNDYRRNLKTEHAGKALAPRIVIFGTIQPGKIKIYLKDNKENGLNNDGFFNRFQLLVFPDEKKVLELPSDTRPETIKQLFQKVFSQLLHKENLLKENQKVVKFSLDAQPLFDRYKKNIELKASKYVGSPMESHIGKYTGLVPSVALVCEFLSQITPKQTSPLVTEISLSSLKMAIRWANYLESHAKKVFGLEDPNLAIAQQILEMRKQLGKTFTVRNVYSKLRKPYYRNKNLTLDSLRYLEKLSYVRALPKSVNSKGGAPRQEWQFNPALFKSQS
jgi:hypothetical protein